MTEKKEKHYVAKGEKEKHYVAKGEKEKSYSEKEKPAYDWRAKCHDKEMEGNT